MITKWTVSNFKSIVKETSLDLATLTLLAGPNSSGKSTILQSLLLVSQTLSHKVIRGKHGQQNTISTGSEISRVCANLGIRESKRLREITN